MLQLKAIIGTNIRRIGTAKAVTSVMGNNSRVAKRLSFRKPAKKPTRARQDDLTKEEKALAAEIKKEEGLETKVEPEVDNLETEDREGYPKPPPKPPGGGL